MDRREQDFQRRLRGFDAVWERLGRPQRPGPPPPPPPGFGPPPPFPPPPPPPRAPGGVPAAAGDGVDFLPALS